MARSSPEPRRPVRVIRTSVLSSQTVRPSASVNPAVSATCLTTLAVAIDGVRRRGAPSSVAAPTRPKRGHRGAACLGAPLVATNLFYCISSKLGPAS